jgi:DnaJ-class molecular chaperone
MDGEIDWYGILQLEHTVDDAVIKKQYWKFVLQLHPDKNKFAGAEAAFKLIEEAQSVLLDREKRTGYDMKLKAKKNCYATS